MTASVARVTGPREVRSAQRIPYAEASRVLLRDSILDGMRDLLLGISAGGLLWLDFTVVASFLVVTAVIAAKTYPRAIL